MGTRHWPEDADDEVERLEGIITTLRQRVAELERFHELDTKQIAYLFEERDALKQLYESSEESVLALKETRNRLAEERDKATQYWNIAEGRCDALKQQRDELVAALEELSLYVAYNGDDWVQKKAKAAIASVKEK